ncbi:hypothetical protein [Ascidiimonas sp. W6]|uniref:hypothetical protein n=1 Tax=Ascidiimonas meishanensis TaxID=3128903 RepID=UPI0030ED9E6C
MIENLPVWIELLFVLTFLSTLAFFHFSNNKPTLITLIILIWSVLQSIAAYKGFYRNTSTIPPRFILIFLPTTLFIIFGCLPRNFSWIMKNRNLLYSTLLHSVRFPVEIVLFYLFSYHMIPQIMTFEGLNFDILVGLIAPIIGLLYWKGKLSNQLLLLFNVVGLIMVTTILTIALLSSDLPFQQFGVKQPNRAISYFPFILLPAAIVPMVMYTHISDIIKLRLALKKV